MENIKKNGESDVVILRLAELVLLGYAFKCLIEGLKILLDKDSKNIQLGMNLKKQHLSLETS